MNIIGILLCAAAIGSVSMWSIFRTQDQASTEILALTCKEQADGLNAQIDSVCHGVQIFAETAVSDLPSAEKLRDVNFLETYLAQLDRLMNRVARNTNGACAYYVRFAPELTDSASGLLYLRNREDGGFYRERLTDLSLYDPEDVEHVGWYYLPMRAGESVWLEPYDNQNLGINMVSYVIPLYKDGVFLGVAGMDIDFDVIIEYVRAIRPYETTHAYLRAADGKIYYHPYLEAGAYPNGEETGSSAGEPSDSVSQGDGRVYHYRGEERKSSSQLLANGMMLVLSVETREINAQRRYVRWVILAITVLIIGLVSAIVLVMSENITRPLQQLTEAATEIYHGNLDVEFPKSGTDEVEILSRTMETTTHYLKEHIEDISNLAFVDQLTGVKSRAEYTKTLARLEEEMGAGQREYALLVVDLNNLKRINDRYGHASGDAYLQGTCAMVCQVFKHSPVYRIGGDEFVVLLKGEDLRDVEGLLKELDCRMEESGENRVPWERYSFARGISFCGEGDQTPQEVFQRADEAMYENKRRMKEGTSTLSMT